MKIKEGFVLFSVMFALLTIPALALAGTAVSDTGQSACYNGLGEDIGSPAKCSDYDDNCKRSFYEEVTEYKLTDRSLALLHEKESFSDVHKLASLKDTSYKEITTGDDPKTAIEAFLDAVETALGTATIGENEALLLEYAAVASTKEIKFYREVPAEDPGDDPTYKEFVYTGARKCFDATGTPSANCDLECYDSASKTKLDEGCPTICYSSTAGDVTTPCQTDNEAGTGKGNDDFYGQDGNYSVNIPVYTKFNADAKEVGDGSDATAWMMFKDSITGLTWLKKEGLNGTTSVSNVNDADNTFSWYDSKQEEDAKGTKTDQGDTEYFISELNRLKLGTFSDWRLPTVQELDSLTNYDDSTIELASGRYWTSTSFAKDSGNAWYVDFGEKGRTIAYESDSVVTEDGGTGTVKYMGKDQKFYIIAVRDGN